MRLRGGYEHDLKKSKIKVTLHSINRFRRRFYYQSKNLTNYQIKWKLIKKARQSEPVLPQRRKILKSKFGCIVFVFGYDDEQLVLLTVYKVR